MKYEIKLLYITKQILTPLNPLQSVACYESKMLQYVALRQICL
jgi:hypothetical protein